MPTDALFINDIAYYKPFLPVMPGVKAILSTLTNRTKDHYT